MDFDKIAKRVAAAEPKLSWKDYNIPEKFQSVTQALMDDSLDPYDQMAQVYGNLGKATGNLIPLLIDLSTFGAFKQQLLKEKSNRVIDTIESLVSGFEELEAGMEWAKKSDPDRE